MTILKPVHLTLLGSLSVRAEPGDSPDAILLRVPHIASKAMPGMPSRWLSAALVGPGDQQMRVAHLVRHVAKGLVDVAGAGSAEELARALLSITCLVAEGREARSEFFESVCARVATRLKQYFVVNAGLPSDQRSIVLGEFTVGRFDGEKFAYQAHRAGSAGWESAARARSGEFCIVRDVMTVTLPLCVTRVNVSEEARPLVHGLVDTAYQALADGAWIDFWRGLEEVQFVEAALRTAYLDVDFLRLSCSQGASMWTVFGEVAGARNGWVSPKTSGVTIVMPQQDAYRRLQRLVTEDMGFTEWRNSEVSRTTKTFCRMLWRAKSLGTMRKVTSADQLDDAFLRHMIALEMLFNEKTSTAGTVARRAAAVVHRMCGEPYEAMKKSMEDLYDLRSRFVHQGKSVNSQELMRVAEVTSCCTEWLLLLARKAEASWADVLRRVDFVAASLEAGFPAPLEVAQDLAIPGARCVPHDLLSVEE